MWEKIGWLGEKLCFGFGALFSLVVVIQGAVTACKGGGWALLTLLGLLGMGGLAVLGLARLRPVRAFSLAVFVLRFAIALEGMGGREKLRDYDVDAVMTFPGD